MCPPKVHVITSSFKLPHRPKHINLTRLNIGIEIGGKIISLTQFSNNIVVIAKSKGDNMQLMNFMKCS